MTLGTEALLIGCDHYGQLIGRIVEIKRSSLVAAETCSWLERSAHMRYGWSSKPDSDKFKSLKQVMNYYYQPLDN